MKKIMFNDRYGLTKAVLNGTKTMTRRVINKKDITQVVTSDGVIHNIDKNVGSYHEYTDNDGKVWLAWSPFRIGEEVAVAQSYHDIEKEIKAQGLPLDIKEEYRKSKAWGNKMFVKPSLMPHRIRITDIKVERLQDISDEDCIREGIVQDYDGVDSYSFNEPATLRFSGKDVFRRCTYAETPKAAFAALIDRISGKGTWESNPWVFTYTFELLT